MINFTNEELNTIIYICQCQGAKLAKEDLEKGIKPSEDRTYKRIIEISNKAYTELTERYN